MSQYRGGESPSKKVARLEVWRRVEEALGEERFRQGSHLCLAGEEGGDISVLLGMGILPDRILVAEVNRHAAKAAQLRFPHVHIYVGNVTRLAHRHVGRIDSAFLDFCGHVSDRNLSEVTEVVETMSSDGVIACEVNGSRENLLRGVVAKLKTDISKSKKVKEGELDRSSYTSFLARSEFISRELLRRVKKSKPRILSRFSYYSETPDWKGLPMCIYIGRKGATGRTPRMHHFSVDDEGLRELALGLSEEGKDAPLLLNIPRSSLAAWKAHKTRGTYA